MSITTTNLKSYDNSWYNPGPFLKRLAWCLCSFFFVETAFPFPNKLKITLLKFFGADIGVGVVIKPKVKIKYPWNLSIGDYVWIGEAVWLDNLAYITIGNHSCLSQGAYLLTGNHNYKKASFDLILSPIVIEDGAWVCAKTTVCPGVTVGSHAILSTGSVASSDLKAFGIYKGVPAKIYKQRIIE